MLFRGQDTRIRGSTRMTSQRPQHIFRLLNNLKENLLPCPGGRGTQEIPYGGDCVPVAPDHLSDIRLPHLDFKNQLWTLLNLCHQDFFGCFYQLPDDKLKKRLHGNSFGRRRSRFFAGFQNHACDRRTGLRAIRYPIIDTSEVQMKILTGIVRIIVTDRFNKLTVPRTPFVRYNNSIVRTILRSFSSQSNRNSHNQLQGIWPSIVLTFHSLRPAGHEPSSSSFFPRSSSVCASG